MIVEIVGTLEATDRRAAGGERHDGTSLRSGATCRAVVCMLLLVDARGEQANMTQFGLGVSLLHC